MGDLSLCWAQTPNSDYQMDNISVPSETVTIQSVWMGIINLLNHTENISESYAQLISIFVFATYSKFQASNHLVCLYSPVCVVPGWKFQGHWFSLDLMCLIHQKKNLGRLW